MDRQSERRKRAALEKNRARIAKQTKKLPCGCEGKVVDGSAYVRGRPRLIGTSAWLEWNIRKGCPQHRVLIDPTPTE